MPSLAPPDLVAAYFRSWRDHNFAILEGVARPDLTYEIHKIDGKRTYDGLVALKAYWDRNARRQRNLILRHEIVDQRSDLIACDFVAQFDDLEEKESQCVYGRIHFQHDRTADPRIVKIYERYSVHRSPLHHFRLQQFIWRAGRRFDSIKWTMRNRIRGAFRVALRVFLGLLIASFGMGIYLRSGGPIPGSLVTLIAGSLTGPEVAALKNSISDWLNVTAGFIGTIIAIFELFPSHATSDRDVEVFDVSKENKDLDIMKRYMGNAKEVTIFSGDFDFLQRFEGLLTTLEVLAQDDRLSLISDYDQPTVRRASAREPRATQLLATLEHSRRIAYSSKLKIRCSVISGASDNLILCRYFADERGKRIERICALHERGRTTEIVRAVFELVRELREVKIPDSLPIIPTNIAVVVTGQTKSGKSFLASRLAEKGFHLVGAGAVIGEIVNGQGVAHPTRRQLLDEGTKFLTAEKQCEFGRVLISRSIGFPRVVFDGIRLPGAISQIKESFGGAFVIYVETTADVRKQRYDQQNDGSIAFDEVAAHPVERAVLPIRQQNDLLLDGNVNITQNLAKALREIGFTYRVTIH